MPLEKQSLNNFLPNGFETLNQEGYKKNFSEDKIKTGYEKDVLDIVSGPNLNNLIDVIGKNTNILSKFMDFIKNMPVNNTLKVNGANQLDYEDVSDLNNKVSKSGDTMTGNLTINKNNGSVIVTGTGYKSFTSKSTDIDYTQTDQVNLNGARLLSNDINGNWWGYVQSWIDSNGSMRTGIASRRSISGTIKECGIAVAVDKNGNAYTYAPTPAAGDNSTKIATTAWVNNEKETISSWGFPSTKYTDLTLGKSGTTYTAPANGWFTLAKTNSRNAEAYIAMNNTTAGQLQIECRQMKHYTGTVEPWARVFIPVSKGDVVRVDYDVDGETKLFRFIYAEGAK